MKHKWGGQITTITKYIYDTQINENKHNKKQTHKTNKTKQRTYKIKHKQT